MNPLRIFIFSVLFYAGNLAAQRSLDSSDIAMNPLVSMKSNTVSIPVDTGTMEGEIPQGTIYVRKPIITPFVKVDYKLFLAHVNPRGAQITIPVTNKETGFTDQQVEIIPTYDSAAYSSKLKRVYPVSAQTLSKFFVENLTYKYQAGDSARADTMIIGMWIDTHGKIKFQLPDNSLAGRMPDELANEIVYISSSIPDWGTAGGYLTPKKIFHPSKYVPESYYCELYIIVSSFPLTSEQKKSGTAYALFDYPLNCPANDAQQERSVLENSVKPSK